jgi:hypothetical protein
MRPCRGGTGANNRCIFYETHTYFDTFASATESSPVETVTLFPGNIGIRDTENEFRAYITQPVTESSYILMYYPSSIELPSDYNRCESASVPSVDFCVIIP